MRPPGARHLSVHHKGCPLGAIKVEYADVIQSDILSFLIYGVVPPSIDHKVIVLVPVLKNSRTVHDSRTGGLTREFGYFLAF